MAEQQQQQQQHQNTECTSPASEWYSSDTAIDRDHDYDGVTDFSADEPLIEIRDGIAHLIHEGREEPSRDLVSDIQFAIASNWSVS